MKECRKGGRKEGRKKKGRKEGNGTKKEPKKRKEGGKEKDTKENQGRFQIHPNTCTNVKFITHLYCVDRKRLEPHISYYTDRTQPDKKGDSILTALEVSDVLHLQPSEVAVGEEQAGTVAAVTPGQSRGHGDDQVVHPPSDHHPVVRHHHQGETHRRHP